MVRDDRGNAKIEWVDAPKDFERPTLTIEDNSHTHKPEEGYNPYGVGRAHPHLVSKPLPRARAKRDLRKLSEWIKQMRELEERKRRGEDDT